MLKTVTTKEKHKWLFPNKMAKAMKKIDTRTQLEATLLSTSLITLSMFLYVLYLAFFGQGWARWMWVFNLSCGVVLLGSSLITTYQQWVGHLDMMGIDPEKEREDIKKSGNIFKRIKMARKAIKFKKQQEKLIEKEEVDNEKQLLEDLKNSNKILSLQGKVEFKFPKVKQEKKRFSISKKVKKEPEDLTKLYEEQKAFLEEN